MFEDQTIELLPERTTMQVTFTGGRGGRGGNGGAGGFGGIAIAINAGNINFGGTQYNWAQAVANGGAGGAGGAGGGGGAGFGNFTFG